MAGVSTALGEAGSAASAGVVFVALVVDFAVLVLLGRDLLPDPVFEPGLAAVGLALVGVAAGDEVGLAGGAGQLVSGSAWVLGATTTTLIIPIVALLGTDTDGSTRVTVTIELLRSLRLAMARPAISGLASAPFKRNRRMPEQDDTNRIEKRTIIDLWDKWVATHVADEEATCTDGLKFYDDLRAEDLPGGSLGWNTVHQWLLSEKRLKD